MISLRVAVPSVLVAAALAGCFTYFVTSPPPVEGDQRFPPTARPKTSPDTGTLTNIDPQQSVEGKEAAFQRAATAILRRVTDAQASVSELPITGHIPLPKKRPISRP
jgi:hypothetical protein